MNDVTGITRLNPLLNDTDCQFFALQSNVDRCLNASNLLGAHDNMTKQVVVLQEAIQFLDGNWGAETAIFTSVKNKARTSYQSSLQAIQGDINSIENNNNVFPPAGTARSTNGAVNNGSNMANGGSNNGSTMGGAAGIGGANTANGSF